MKNIKANNNKGIALLTTLYFSIILFAVSSLFVFAVLSERNASRVERGLSKSFYAAQASAQAGLEELDVLINTYMYDTVSAASASGVISKAQEMVSKADGIGWLVYAVRKPDTEDIDEDGDTQERICFLAQDGDQTKYTRSNVILGDANYSYEIFISEKTDPITIATDVWDFPYSYKIEATAIDDNISSKVSISGDFTVRIQKDNFARYALFTNRQAMPNGTNVWFTDKTNFSGPLHTNDRYNIALNPSGTFDGTVTQEEQTARFYNNGWPVLIDGDSNGSADVPTFNDGFNRDVDEISFSSSSEQNMVDQVKGNTNTNNNGIYLPKKNGSLTGGIYVKGDCTVALNVDANDNAVYSIVQGSTTKNITVNKGANQTTVQTVGGSTVVYDGAPEGADGVGSIIYVEGNITSLGGSVQRETELTIASKNDMVISNNVLYSDYDAGSGTPGQVGYVPPSVPQDINEQKNLLGLVSWNGDVHIGTAAPDNVMVHGTVLASEGILTVDNYDSGVPRGAATILGGVITDDYGAFGLFNGSTGLQISGYGRNFVYDDRMQMGKAPPYFPTINTFIAFTNDIADKIAWQEGE